MSVMHCDHCDRRYDTDFDEYCPRCSQEPSRHSELGLKHGETCQWCGAEWKDYSIEAYYAKRYARKIFWAH